VSNFGQSVQISLGNKLDSAARSGFRGDGVLQGILGLCQQPITKMHGAKLSLSGTTILNNFTTIKISMVYKPCSGLQDPRHRRQELTKSSMKSTKFCLLLLRTTWMNAAT
jgi:hypothetical protein